MHEGGRPTLRTPEIIEALCDAVSHGLSNEDAAAIAGIGVSTLYEWLTDEEFRGILRGAIARRKLSRVKALETAEPGRWQQLAWLLERSDINFCRPEVRRYFEIRANEPEIKNVTDQQQLLRDIELLYNGKRQ
jgi:hypothetical protein